jgi:hypothetical protein
MALNTQMAIATVNAQANTVITNLANGWCRIYSGTQPATADTAISSQVLLAELRYAATAAPAPSNGLITFNAMTADSSANNTGTATWFRSFASDGTTVVMDGNVGATGSTSNLELNSTGITAGANVAISSATHNVLRSSTGL